MKKNKRGISPLLATVLLIGFAIAIAILVWSWYDNFIKTTVEKTGGTNSGKLACASEVKFRVKNICTKSDQVIIDIENKGSNLDDLRISVKGSTSTKTINIGTVISSTETKELSAPISNIGVLQKVTLVPIMIRENIPTACSDKRIELKNIESC